MVGKEEPAAAKSSESQLWETVVKVAEATLYCLEPFEEIGNKHVNDAIYAVRNLLDHHHGRRDFELIMRNHKPPTTATESSAAAVTTSSSDFQHDHDGATNQQDYSECNDMDNYKSKKRIFLKSQTPPPSSSVVLAKTPHLIHNRKHDDFNDYGSMSNFKFPTVDTTLFAASAPPSAYITPFSASPIVNNKVLLFSTAQHIHNNKNNKHQYSNESTVLVNLGEGRGKIIVIAVTNEHQLNEAIQEMNQAKCIALNCEYLTQKKEGGGPPILKVLVIAVSKEKGFTIQVDLISHQIIHDKLKPILEDDQKRTTTLLVAWSFRASAMAIEGYFKDIYLNDVLDLQALLQDVTGGENLNLGAAVNRFASEWEGHDEFQRVINKRQSSSNRYQISLPGSGRCIWDITPLLPMALVYSVFKVLGLMALYESSSTMYIINNLSSDKKKYYWPHTITSVASPDGVQRWMKEHAMAINWRRDNSILESHHQQRCKKDEQQEGSHQYQEEDQSSLKTYSVKHFRDNSSNLKNEFDVNNNNNINPADRSTKQEMEQQQQYHHYVEQVSTHQQYEDEQVSASHYCFSGTNNNERAIINKYNNNIDSTTTKGHNNNQELKEQYDPPRQVSTTHQQIQSSPASSTTINDDGHTIKSINIFEKQQQVANLHQQAENSHSQEKSFVQSPNDNATTQQCDGDNSEISAAAAAARWNAFADQCVNNNTMTAENYYKNKIQPPPLTPPSEEQQQQQRDINSSDLSCSSSSSSSSSSVDLTVVNKQQQQWSSNTTGDVVSSTIHHINTGDAEESTSSSSSYCPSSPTKQTVSSSSVGRASYYYTLLEQRSKREYFL